MVNSVDFSKRLQKILDYYGLSATAFSEKLNFNRSTISHLLSARNKPSLEFVMKVLEHFPEVELYWLLNGTGNFPTIKNINSNTSTAIDFHQTDEIKRTNEYSAIVDQNTGDYSGSNNKSIDRIVIFYKDGSFKAYKNE